MTLDDDPRWHRFNDTSRVCPCCGQRHSGVFDIAFDNPDPEAHALGVAQQSGISFDRLLDIYAAAGQDIRPHLMDD